MEPWIFRGDPLSGNTTSKAPWQNDAPQILWHSPNLLYNPFLPPNPKPPPPPEESTEGKGFPFPCVQAVFTRERCCKPDTAAPLLSAEVAALVESVRSKAGLHAVDFPKCFLLWRDCPSTSMSLGVILDRNVSQLLRNGPTLVPQACSGDPGCICEFGRFIVHFRRNVNLLPSQTCLKGLSWVVFPFCWRVFPKHYAIFSMECGSMRSVDCWLLPAFRFKDCECLKDVAAAM